MKTEGGGSLAANVGCCTGRTLNINYVDNKDDSGQSHRLEATFTMQVAKLRQIGIHHNAEAKMGLLYHF